ncbi:hypothetical protein ACHWQZ_G013213 [Mnemiopsis leidyi]
MTMDGDVSSGMVGGAQTAGDIEAEEKKRLAALFHKLIPAFIFGVLLLVCVFAMACRNIVRYFSGYEEDEEDMMDGEDNQNNISSYKLSDNLEDTISPQNAKQLVVDSKMTDVIYT